MDGANHAPTPLATELATTRDAEVAPAVPRADGDSIVISMGVTLAEAEQTIILATLRHYRHQKERTAAALGISLKTLYNRLKQYTADKGSDG
ncbi:Bacterial regulatory protein, Fis family [compost metagenome]